MDALSRCPASAGNFRSNSEVAVRPAVRSGPQRVISPDGQQVHALPHPWKRKMSTLTSRPPSKSQREFTTAVTRRREGNVMQINMFKVVAVIIFACGAFGLGACQNRTATTETAPASTYSK